MMQVWSAERAASALGSGNFAAAEVAAVERAAANARQLVGDPLPKVRAALAAMAPAGVTTSNGNDNSER